MEAKEHQRTERKNEAINYSLPRWKGKECIHLVLADDAMLLKRIRSREDCKEMQKDLHTMSGAKHERWNLMQNKCHGLEMGKMERRPT